MAASPTPMTGTLPPVEECQALHTGDSGCGSDCDGEPAHVDLRAATPALSPFGAAAQTGSWTRLQGSDAKLARPSVEWGGAAAFHRSPAVPAEGYPLARASFDLGPRLGKPENSRQVSGVARESGRIPPGLPSPHTGGPFPVYACMRGPSDPPPSPPSVPQSTTSCRWQLTQRCAAGWRSTPQSQTAA